MQALFHHHNHLDIDTHFFSLPFTCSHIHGQGTQCMTVDMEAYTTHKYKIWTGVLLTVYYFSYSHKHLTSHRILHAAIHHTHTHENLQRDFSLYEELTTMKVGLKRFLLHQQGTSVQPLELLFESLRAKSCPLFCIPL